jgi:hypothetical protein
MIVTPHNWKSKNVPGWMIRPPTAYPVPPNRHQDVALLEWFLGRYCQPSPQLVECRRCFRDTPIRYGEQTARIYYDVCDSCRVDLREEMIERRRQRERKSCRKYYEKNRERILENKRGYYAHLPAEEKERRRARARARYHRNKKRNLARQRERYAAKKEAQ